METTNDERLNDASPDVVSSDIRAKDDACSAAAATGTIVNEEEAQAERSAAHHGRADRTKEFPEILMNLLESGISKRGLRWTTKEGVAFIIDPQRLTEKVLKQKLHVKYRSFIRRLQRWGFERVPPEELKADVIMYRHPFFRKGCPELLKKIIKQKRENAEASRRAKTTTNKPIGQSNTNGNDDNNTNTDDACGDPQTSADANKNTLTAEVCTEVAQPASFQSLQGQDNNVPASLNTLAQGGHDRSSMLQPSLVQPVNLLPQQQSTSASIIPFNSINTEAAGNQQAQLQQQIVSLVRREPPPLQLTTLQNQQVVAPHLLDRSRLFQVPMSATEPQQQIQPASFQTQGNLQRPGTLFLLAPSNNPPAANPPLGVASPNIAATTRIHDNSINLSNGTLHIKVTVPFYSTQQMQPPPRPQPPVQLQLQLQQQLPQNPLETVPSAQLQQHPAMLHQPAATIQQPATTIQQPTLIVQPNGLHQQIADIIQQSGASWTNQQS